MLLSPLSAILWDALGDVKGLPKGAPKGGLQKGPKGAPKGRPQKDGKRVYSFCRKYVVFPVLALFWGLKGGVLGPFSDPQTPSGGPGCAKTGYRQKGSKQSPTFRGPFWTKS